MTSSKLILATAVSVLALAACSKQETAADARVDTVKEDTNVALTQAKAAYNAAVEQCESTIGKDRDACKSAAQATLDAAQAAVDARIKALKE